MTKANDIPTDLHKEAAALVAKGEVQIAQDILFQRILQTPDDYKARKILRETYEMMGKSSHATSGSHHCPCCNNSFPVFLPGGPSFRPNACCPACESLERHRFLYLLFSRSSLWRSDAMRLLHVAAEPCLCERFRTDFGPRYHTMDLLRDSDFRGDLGAMPIRSESTDIIITNHVLEHVQNDISAMNEMFRVLRRQGKAFLGVPLNQNLIATKETPKGSTPQDLVRLFGQEDHVRIYGQDFKERLERAGFIVQKLDYKVFTATDEQKVYGLNPSDILWEATRP